MGKDKNGSMRVRKGHPTPPAYAMQSRQQFCIWGVTDMGMKPTCRGIPRDLGKKRPQRGIPKGLETDV